MQHLWFYKNDLKKGECIMSKRTGIMLATMFTEKLFNKMPKPVYIQPKIEGDRLRAILNVGMTKLLSSGAKERISIPHIYKELGAIQRSCSIELDGEVYRHGMRHSEIRSIISRTKNLHPCHKELEYHVFDIVSTLLSQKERYRDLKDFFKQKEFKYIKVVPTTRVNTLREVQESYDMFLQLGYEGIIIRNIYASYVRRKCTTLLKLKPRVSDFFEIVTVNLEYDTNGVSKNTFGSFTCVTKDGKKFNVGTGCTNFQRDLIWKNRDAFINKPIKIRFQDYTRVRRVPKLLSIDKQWLIYLQERLTNNYC